MKESQITNFYVSNIVTEKIVCVEPWVQYDTFGKCIRYVVVSPKRCLLYSKVDSNGKTTFYDANTHEPVIIRGNKQYHTYETNSSLALNFYNSSYGATGDNLYDGYIKSMKKKKNKYDFIIPFEDYIEQKTGKKIEKVSLIKAKLLLKFYNSFSNKPIVLSEDPEKATKQLENIGLTVPKKIKEKIKTC